MRERLPLSSFLSQIEAQRSEFDLERRSSKISKLSRWRGSERYGACSDDAMDTAAELGCGDTAACVLRPVRRRSEYAVPTPPNRHDAGAWGWSLCRDSDEVYPYPLSQNLKKREGLLYCGMASGVSPHSSTLGKSVGCSQGAEAVHWHSKRKKARKAKRPPYGDLKLFARSMSAIYSLVVAMDL